MSASTGDTTSPNSNLMVLVEDDPVVRLLWQNVAKEKQLPLLIYETASAFLAHIERFSADTVFYLDQDLGDDRGAGVRLARIIKQRFDAHVHIVTNYEPCDFAFELRAGIVNQVSGKFPYPFNKPSMYPRRTGQIASFV